jgi:hypothetical protein
VVRVPVAEDAGVLASAVLMATSRDAATISDQRENDHVDLIRQPLPQRPQVG